MVECSNPHRDRWALLRRAWAADVLTSHQATSIVQGFYAHRISVLARSKKLLGVIIVVSGQNSSIVSQASEHVAPYTALLHSTWRWDSGRGPSAADEILLRAY